MNTQSANAFWKYNHTAKTIRLERRFAFDTPDESECFAEKAGMAISFPNLAVFCDPIFGHPEASVTIECKDDSMSLATASLLFESLEELRNQIIIAENVA